MAVSAAADSPDPDRRLIAGRYRLISLLAVDGISETYCASDTLAHIPVVVKMPRREVRHDKELMARFTRETEAMRCEAHASIVPIADSGEHEGCPFVVLRLLSGGTLHDLMNSGTDGNVNPSPPGMLHHWLPSIAAALDFIHGRGGVYGDVKPANILFDDSGKAFFHDSVIDRVVDRFDDLPAERSAHPRQMASGSEPYMAPELLLSRASSDGRSDQYSLAVTVYEVLCGERPFKGSETHVVVEHLSHPVPPLNRAKLGLPSSLCAAIEKSLSKKPEDRFDSCGQFAATVLKDIHPQAREPNVVRMLCPNCRTMLWLSSLAGGRIGTCPSCKASLSIAKDFSAIRLADEVPAEWRSFDPEEGWLGGAPDTKTTLPKSPPLRAVVLALGSVAALLLVRMSCRHWATDREQAGADVAAKHVAEQRSAELASAAELIAAEGEKAAKDEGMGILSDTRVDTQMPENRPMPTGLPPLELLQDRIEPQLPYTTLTPQEAYRVIEQSRRKKYNPWRVRLSKLTSLSGPVAEVLGKSGLFVELDGLTAIAPEVAESLKGCGGLSLNGLTTLSPDVAEPLSQCRGSLYLNGLTTLAPAVAEALAKKQAAGVLHQLQLVGLTTLSDDAARALSQCRGPLLLSSLTTLSDEAKEALQLNPGVVFRPSR